MARRRIMLSLVMALIIYRALAGAVPEQLYPPPGGNPDNSQQVSGAGSGGSSQPQFAVKDTLKELWDSMEPSQGAGAPASSPAPPLSDHDKYEMLKSMHVSRDVQADKCNRSALASLNNLAEVAAHLYSASVSDYVSFHRNRQFELCKMPAIYALRELLADDEARIEAGDGAARRLDGIVDLGERIRRQGIKLFGSKETRKALLIYQHEKDLHPLDISGGDKKTYQATMEHLLDNMCRGTMEPRVVEVLDVLEQLHADHSLTWDEFLANEIHFIVGSIACRDILEDKQAYIDYLYTVSVSGTTGGY